MLCVARSRHLVWAKTAVNNPESAQENGSTANITNTDPIQTLKQTSS